ncbi:hypothetical protein [Nocardia sp. BMG51109]|uniref:hypothetical protein n=1 Tax=Nocardia sp. BMG51109 TaxID=1056816 RepID=UPI0004664B15|nr:hypothetical protein [Nocardia sp. BMG51109]
MQLHWHNVGARVRILEPAASIGPIEIRWGDLLDDAGVKVYLDIEDARALIGQLSALIAELSDGIDNDVDDTATVNDDGATVSTPKEVA